MRVKGSRGRQALPQTGLCQIHTNSNSQPNWFIIAFAFISFSQSRGSPYLISSPFFLHWLNGTSFSETDCIEIESLWNALLFIAFDPAGSFICSLLKSLQKQPLVPPFVEETAPLTFQFVYAKS